VFFDFELLISVNKLFSCFLRCSRNDSLESVIKEAVKVEEVTQRTLREPTKVKVGIYLTF